MRILFYLLRLKNYIVFADNFALEMEEDFSEEDNRGVQNEETFKNFIDETRANDIRLLDYLNVGVIVDLMVEKKKVKFGMK